MNDYNKKLKLEKLKDPKLNIELIEILVSDREGTPTQRKELSYLKDFMGDKFYIEVIFFLAHIQMDDGKIAKKFFDNILTHKINMESKLKRKYSIEVATLDYLKDVRNIIDKPTIINEDKITSLTELALRDGFTQLYDKKIMIHDLKQEIEKSKRYKSSFSLGMLDLDNLKEINDRFGHEAGDRALKKATEILKENTRKADSSYRYGGDEFTIIFPELEKEQAYKAVKKIMKKIRRIKLKVPAGEIKISASIGLAAFSRDNIKSVINVIKKADSLLYKAKETGKNKIVISGQEEK